MLHAKMAMHDYKGNGYPWNLDLINTVEDITV